MPRVIELGGDPDLFTGDAGIDDSLAVLGYVAICKSDTRLSGDGQPGGAMSYIT